MSTPEIESLKGRLRPKGGWKPTSWYLIDVAFSANNCIHRALLYTGFLTANGTPSGYNSIQSTHGPYEEDYHYGNAYYLKPVKFLFDEKYLESEVEKICLHCNQAIL